MYHYQLRLQSRNVRAEAQLAANALETTISAAVKHRHEENIQLIKNSLVKNVRVSTSDLC